MVKTIPEFKGTIALGLSSSKSSRNSAFQAPTYEVNGSNSMKDSLRHEEAERKRQESLKQQRESYAKKQSLIRSSFKSIDSSTVPANKKIKFASSSSSSEQESDDEVSNPKATSARSAVTSSEPSNGRKNLFDDDEDEDEMDGDAQFSAPKFDGVMGSKLLELQSRFGGADTRFRMDERFLDDGEPEESKVLNNEENNEDTVNRKQERHSNIRILERVLGKPLEKDEVDSPKIKTVPYLRFDPENPAHHRFQIQKESEDVQDEEPEAEASFSSEEASESEKSPSDVKREPAPVGLDVEFAEQLRRKVAQKTTTQPADSGFSLRKLFGREDIATEENDVAKNENATAVSLPSWQRSLMHVKDSSSEDEEETPKPSSGDVTKSKDPLERRKKKFVGQSTFFFYDEKDQRISGEGEKFRRQEDIETMRNRWEKQRGGLIQFYKSRRKEALKKQRLRQEKEAAQQEQRKRRERNSNSRVKRIDNRWKPKAKLGSF